MGGEGEGGGSSITLPSQIYAYPSYDVVPVFHFSTTDFKGRKCYRSRVKSESDQTIVWEEMYWGTLVSKRDNRGINNISIAYPSHVDPDGATIEGNPANEFLRLNMSMMIVAIVGPTGILHETEPDDGFIIYSQSGGTYWTPQNIIKLVAQEFDEEYAYQQITGGPKTYKLNGRWASIGSEAVVNAVPGYYEMDQMTDFWDLRNIPRNTMSIISTEQFIDPDIVAIGHPTTYNLLFAVGTNPAYSIHYYANDRFSFYPTAKTDLISSNLLKNVQYNVGLKPRDEYTVYYWYKIFSEVI